MSDTRAPRFNRIFFTLTGGALLLTFLINLIVDPLGLFGMPTWQGFNAEKTQYQKYLRMAKPHAVRMLKPRGLILGTSRAENVSPDHLGWHAEARPTYNMAIQSSRIHEVLRNLQHAQAQNRLKQVVLFLDDFMFSPRVRSETGFDEARLDREPTPKINGAWADDLVMALFSYDALVESITTVRSQDARTPVIYLANGAHDPTRFQSEVDRMGGHRNLFLQQAKPPDGKPFTGDDRPPYDDFRALLTFCRKENIDLRLVINPMHAHMLELNWLNGTWGKNIEDWRRRLVRILTEEAADSHASKPFPLWDFADYNSITTEPVPPLGDANTKMNWWWESSHYKSDVGRLMLDRVLGNHSGRQGTLNDFGIQLNLGNIEPHLRSVRVKHAEYASSHQIDISEISQKREEVLRKIIGSPAAHTAPR